MRSNSVDAAELQWVVHQKHRKAIIYESAERSLGSLPIFEHVGEFLKIYVIRLYIQKHIQYIAVGHNGVVFNK